MNGPLLPAATFAELEPRALVESRWYAGQKSTDDLQILLTRTAHRAHGALGARAKLVRRRPVRQQAADLALELRLAADLERGSVLQQERHVLVEVVHMRSVQDGIAAPGRLHQVPT